MKEKLPQDKTTERSEEERNFQSIELDTDEFIKIIESRAFLESLEVAAKETQASGYETGFDVNILEDKTVFIPEVVKGGTTGMQRAESIGVIDGNIFLKGENLDKKRGCLLAFHFHPDIEGSIIPSGSDLTEFLKYSLAPAFLGVGQIDTHSSVKILLVYPEKFIVAEEIREYEERAASVITNQKDIQRLLKDCGFNSAIIRFRIEKEKYVLESSKKRLGTMKPVRILTIGVMKD